VEFKKWFNSIHMPVGEQQTKYSCGAACLRIIAKRYGIHKTEQEFMKLLGTTPKDGTWPENLIEIGKKLGLNVHDKMGMSIDELKSLLDKKIPVICSFQAWGDKKNYSKKNKDGHYAIAIGYNDKEIMFEDPSIRDGKRGSLKYKDFLSRWHDIDAHGHNCKQLGIAMWKSEPKNQRKVSKVKEIE
jgi:predicted double-glycine peptidase